MELVEPVFKPDIASWTALKLLSQPYQLLVTTGEVDLDLPDTSKGIVQ